MATGVRPPPAVSAATPPLLSSPLQPRRSELARWAAAATRTCVPSPAAAAQGLRVAVGCALPISLFFAQPGSTDGFAADWADATLWASITVRQSQLHCAPVQLADHGLTNHTGAQLPPVVWLLSHRSS